MAENSTPKLTTYNDLNEDSLLCTPRPQATSTVDHRKANNLSADESYKLLVSPDDCNIELRRSTSLSYDKSINHEINRPADSCVEDKFLVNERDLVGSLKKELDKVYADIHRESGLTGSEAKNSSLGIINVDEVEDIGSSKDDTSEVLESLVPNVDNDCEMSWRMMRELARQSISSRRKSSLSKHHISAIKTASVVPLKTIDSAGSVDKNNSARSERNKSLAISFNNNSKRELIHKYNPFEDDNCSGVSLSSETFVPGEFMSAKLLEDEVAWMHEKAEIPVPINDQSLSGIFPDDDALSQASSYLRKGSGPLGDLDSGLDPDSRPNFGFSICSPIKRTESKETSPSLLSKNDYDEMLKQYRRSHQFNDLLDEVPTKELPSNDNSIKDSANDLQKQKPVEKVRGKTRNRGVQPSASILNNTVVNEDRLSVSSVASITYIAELLGDMSVNTSPRHIIDKMLSAGSSKDKISGSSNLNYINQNNIDLKHKRSTCSNPIEVKQKPSKLNFIQEDSDSSCTEDKLGEVVSRVPERTAEMDVDRNGEVITIDDDNDVGKENLNESIWTAPSRKTSMDAGVNNKYEDDVQIFKIPDSKRFSRRRKKDATKNISVLSDATNTSRDLTIPDRRLTKNVNPSIIDVETNKSILNVTETDTITRYSSSNVSSVNNFHNQINMVNNDCDEDDIYNFEIMQMDKLPSYSSLQELNSNRESSANDDVIIINESTIDRVCKNGELDASVVCLSNVNDLANLSVSADSDNVNVVPICVGTINRCTLPVFDLLSDECKDGYLMKLQWSVDDIVRNGKSVSVKEAKDSVVRLYFPDETVFIQNRDNKDIQVHVIPLVGDFIKVGLQIKITVMDKNLAELTSPYIVRCMLKIVGQHPQVTIEPNSLMETSFHGVNFGLLPEESMQKSFIKITNNGNVRVPLLLEITKLSSDILIFYLMDTDNNGTEKSEKEVLKKIVILDPGETIEEPVYCFTPSLSKSSTRYQSQRGGSRRIGQVSGTISVRVASTENDINLPELAELQLLALVGLTRVLIAAHCNPLMIPALGSKSLVVRNAGVIPIVLKFHCDNPLFSVRGDHFISLEPDENGTVDISFTPDTVNPDLNGDSWKGTLWLSIVSSEIRYSVDLQGEIQQTKPTTPKKLNSASSPTCSGSNPTTPLTSRSSSPCSSSSSSLTGDIAPLELASTCSALVWASCPLLRCDNGVNKKSCVLRNKRNHREKLLMTISDPLSSYKIVEEKGTLVSEMRLNLEAMESRQITVSFAPTQVGPCKGTLIITRVCRKSGNNLPVPSQKKVLHLYGYGGKSVLNIRGVFRDPDLRMWTYLDSNTLQTTFTLENTGDGTAFVKLTQDIAATGITIRPEECLIAAHKSIDVELTFSPTAGRADHLLTEPYSGEVLNVTRIVIMNGDEATRLRLKRLYCRMVTEKQQGDALLMERLAVLNNLFPGTSVNEVSCLKDKMDGMKTLWLEGIRESTLGVLLERSALENAQFDSTAQFIDLATTIMDETLCTSKLQQLIVAPRVVSISPKEPISSFSLRNTTVLQSRFHVEIPQPSFGITVEPLSGMLPPHTSCLLTVKHTPGNSGCRSDDHLVTSNSSSIILKIHSDLMAAIEVPVNWHKIS